MEDREVNVGRTNLDMIMAMEHMRQMEEMIRCLDPLLDRIDNLETKIILVLEENDRLRENIARGMEENDRLRRLYLAQDVPEDADPTTLSGQSQAAARRRSCLALWRAGKLCLKSSRWMWAVVAFAMGAVATLVAMGAL